MNVTFLATLAVAILGLAAPARALDAFTPDHVAKLRSVTSASVSPDGQSVAYLLSVPRTPFDEDSGPSYSELWVLRPSGASRPFITGKVSIGSVAWTPDGREISFTTKRGDDTDAALWAIPIDGGEAQRLLSLPGGVSAYTWSPDGRRVACLATDPVPVDRKELGKKGFDAEIYEESFRPVRIHIAERGSDASPRVLDVDGVPSEIAWSPAGDRLAMYVAPTPLVDDSFMKRRLRVVDVESGAAIATFDNPGKVGEFAWSPDGTRIALISAEDIHDPNAGRLVVVPAGGGALEFLPLGVDGDFDHFAWQDASTIVYLASVGTTSRIGRIRLGGEHEVLVPEGEHVLSGLSISADGRTAAMLVESARHPKEVAVFSEGNAAPRRMTDSNPWLRDMRFAPQEIVRFEARDGMELEGILVRPLEARDGERHPLILCVHGGPEAHDTNGWSTYYSKPGQVAAARGFAVFYPNYRGSTGRGVAFSKLGQADYAGKEFDDLVDAVDHLVRIGLVDTKRVGVTGGSYGGFASAWCATKHSARFAASVMFVGISDHISKTGTTDIPNEMFLVHARKKLYDNWQWYLERSPIYYADQCRTPTLILHGKEDTRVHPSQSMELYRHLKVLGQVPVRLVFYPGEGHGNRKSAGRLDYNLRMLQWFEHYLKGPGGEPPAPELDYGRKKDEAAEKAPKDV